MIEQPSRKDAVYLANVEKIGGSPDNILHIDNVLPEEDHKTILNFLKARGFWIHEPWDAKSVPYKDIPADIMEMLVKIFTIAYEKTKTTYGVELNPMNKNNLNLLKFPIGMFLSPHIDTDSVEGNHIAAIYYINDDYTGGEIVFPDFDITIKPKPNTLIIFPGNENYLHEVKTTYQGERLSSSMWFQFAGSTFSQRSEWYGQK